MTLKRATIFTIAGGVGIIATMALTKRYRDIGLWENIEDVEQMEELMPEVEETTPEVSVVMESPIIVNKDDAEGKKRAYSEGMGYHRDWPTYENLNSEMEAYFKARDWAMLENRYIFLDSYYRGIWVKSNNKGAFRENNNEINWIDWGEGAGYNWGKAIWYWWYKAILFNKGGSKHNRADLKEFIDVMAKKYENKRFQHYSKRMTISGMMDTCYALWSMDINEDLDKEKLIKAKNWWCSYKKEASRKKKT